MPRFILRPRASCVVEIVGGVGERGEDEHLAICSPRLMVVGLRTLSLDHLPQLGELGVALGVHLLRRGMESAKRLRVLDQILPPADRGPRP